MQTRGIATFCIRGRADAISTDSRSTKDPRGRKCHSPVLLRALGHTGKQPVGRSRIFQEESHQEAYLFSHAARSRLHRFQSATFDSTPRCDPHVPLSFRLRGQLDSVTNLRVTTFRTVRPASEDMMTPEDNPLTIVSLYTRLQIYTELA